MNRQNARIAQYGDMTGEEIEEGFKRLVYANRLAGFDGGIALFEGQEDGTSDIVTFGVDIRVGAALLSRMEEDGEVVCELEGWEIVSRRPIICGTCGGPVAKGRHHGCTGRPS